MTFRGATYTTFLAAVSRGQTWLFREDGGKLEPILDAAELRAQLSVDEGIQAFLKLMEQKPEAVVDVITGLLLKDPTKALEIRKLLKTATWRPGVATWNCQRLDAETLQMARSLNGRAIISLSPNGHRIAFKLASNGHWDVTNGVLRSPALGAFCPMEAAEPEPLLAKNLARNMHEGDLATTIPEYMSTPFMRALRDLRAAGIAGPPDGQP